jgi:hypothetical protein
MTSRRLLSAAALLAIPVLLHTLALSARESPQGREREMYVSVLDGEGTPVPGLSPDAFIVREDGVRREVLRALPAIEPIDLAILLDDSQAATDSARDIRDAVQSFIRKMHGDNRIALVTFGERPTIRVDYTGSLEPLIASAGRYFPVAGSGAYLLEALMEVTRGVERRDLRRPVMVVVATEGQEFSNRHYDAVLDPLKESGATLHVLSLAGRAIPEPTDESRYRDIVIDQGTRLTGGRREVLLSSMALGPALDRLAEELLNQYRITYVRPDVTVPPERVEVEMVRPGLTARGTPVRGSGGRR